MFVKLFLRPLGSDPDPAFDCRVVDCDEMPRLEVCATRRGPGGANTMLDYFARNGTVGIIANCSPSLHHRVKFLRPMDQLAIRVIGDPWWWNQTRRCHAKSLLIKHIRVSEDCVVLIIRSTHILTSKKTIQSLVAVEKD